MHHIRKQLLDEIDRLKARVEELEEELHDETAARNHLEGKLRQSQDKLSAIVQQSTTGVSDHDPILRDVNETESGQKGFAPHNLQRQTALESLPPAMLDIVVNVLQRAQAEIATNEEKFRSLFEFAPDAILVADETGHIVLVNAKTESLTGYGRQELVGQSLEMLLPPHLRSPHVAHRTGYMASPMSRSMGEGLDLVMRHKDGSEIPVEISLSTANTADGILVMAYIVDITERQRAQEQIESQHNFLRQIIDLNDSFIFVKDEAGRFTLANKAVATALGVTPEDMIGKTDADLSPHTQETEFFRKIDLEVIRTRQPKVIPDERVTNPETGEQRWYRTAKIPLIAQHGAGEIAQVLGVSADITSLKRAEQALRASEEQFRAIFEQAAVGISLMTPDGHWLKVNQKLGDIVGYSEDELMGMTFKDITYPDDLDDDLDLFDRTLAGEISSYSMEKRYIHKNGAVVWVDLTVSLVRDPVGDPQYWVSVIEDINERKRIELILHENEAQFRATFEQAAVGIAHVGLDGRWMKINQKLCDIVGYTSEALLQLTFQDITHPDDIDADLDYVRQMLADEIQTYSMEKRYIRKDGSHVWINLTVSLARDATDKPIYFISVVEDIHERKLLQQALSENEERYRLLANNLPKMGVILFDQNLTCVMEGPLIEHHIENLTHIIDTTMVQPLPEPDSDRQFQYQVVLAGEEMAFEHRANGSFYEATARPIRQPDGKISAGMLAVRDITEQKRAENELRLLLELSDQIAASPDFDTALRTVLTLMCTDTNWVLGEAWVPDPDSNVLRLKSAHLANPESFALRHYTEMSRDYELVLGEDIGGRIWASRAIEWQDDLQHLSADAFSRLDLAKAANLSSALGVPISTDGHVLAVLIFYMVASRAPEARTINLASAVASQLGSVLRQKQLQGELEQYGQALARSNEELQQFAYVASHDLQEPLRVITSYLQLLERRYKGELGEDANKYIDRAVNAAGRMKSLIEDLLQYSRVTTRGETFQPVDIAHVLENVLNNLETAIDESGAIIHHDSMPTIAADGRQIAQVFQNLIGNAIKFRGQNVPEIYVHVQKQNDHWAFSVQDNGIGIESQYFERIFTIFQRLHSRRHYEGTGIGLAICRKIIERHGGNIWVRSEPDQGSTFYFTLPDGHQG